MSDAKIVPFTPDQTPARVHPTGTVGRVSDAEISSFPSNPTPPVGQPLLREVLGQVLRDERQAQGRTLIDVADEAAVSFPYLSEVERGRKEVSSDLLRAISRALGLGLDDVLTRSARRATVPSGHGPQLLAA